MFNLTICTLTPREQHILDNATSYTAYAFRGRGDKCKVACSTREDAIEQAAHMAEDRGALVYAVFGNADALIHTIERRRTP